MSNEHKKVWIDDKLHVMTIKAHEQHLATIKSLQNAHDKVMDKCTFTTIETDGSHVPTDKYGNYIDR